MRRLKRKYIYGFSVAAVNHGFNEMVVATNTVADHDGDTVPIRVLFSDEANAEAKRIATSTMDIVDIMGKMTKNVGNEINQGITVLTRRAAS